MPTLSTRQYRLSLNYINTICPNSTEHEKSFNFPFLIFESHKSSDGDFRCSLSDRFELLMTMRNEKLPSRRKSRVNDFIFRHFRVGSTSVAKNDDKTWIITKIFKIVSFLSILYRVQQRGISDLLRSSSVNFSLFRWPKSTLDTLGRGNRNYIDLNLI